MKRLLPFTPLLVLAALLLSPTVVLSGAKRGLDIWWNRMFPALLPSFICVRMAQNMGLLRSARNRPRGQLVTVIGFSLVSGAPNGAKLLHAMVADGALSSEEGERLLPLTNCVSPAFLLSIIASELLKNKALSLPIALAFYGTILILLIPHIVRQFDVVAPLHTASSSFTEAVSAAIETSMLDMLRIGGCILFVCTLLSLFRPVVRDDRAFAALASLMEVSTGASEIARLDMSLRLQISLMTGAAAFGGLSLTLQTVCCYPELKLWRYLIGKLMLGVLTGLVCYLIFPIFPSLSAAFADRQTVLTRSLSLSALVLSSIISAAFMGILSLMIGQRERN